MSKDNFYLKHDTTAASDPKIVAMVMRFGMEGYGRWWRLVEILRDQSDGRLPSKKWGLTTCAIAWGCSEDDAKVYIDALVTTFNLLQTDGETVWSERLCRDMDYLNKRRDSARQSAASRWGVAENANALKTDTNALESDAMAMRTHRKPMQAEASNESNVKRAEQQPETSAADTPIGPGSPTSPPPAAPFLTLLKTALAQNSLLLRADELDNCASRMIAAGADSPGFLAWAVAKASTARIPSRWFVRGIIEWDWIAKFKAEGAPSSSAPEPQHVTHPELDTPPPPLNDDEAEGRRRFLLRHALDKRAKHSEIPFTEMEILLLAEHDAAHAPPSEPPPPVDDFDDDIPGLVQAEAQA